MKLTVLRRPTVAAALAVVALTAGSAAAGPSPVCNLVKDDVGDATEIDSGVPGPKSDAIDIVTADIGNDKETITGVIRVAKYTPNETATVHGKRFIVAFSGAGLKPMYLTALDTPTAQAFNFGSTSTDELGRTTYTSTGAATGRFDAAKSEITITAKLSDIAAAGFGTLKAGQQVKGINAVTFRRINTSLFAGDDAATNKKYVAGSPSCVKRA